MCDYMDISIKDYIEDSFNEIIPYLYISTFTHVHKLARDMDRDFLVVNCTKDLPMVRPDGIRVAVNDDGNEESTIEMYNAFFGIMAVIDDQIARKRDVIVHCMAGQQRSPTVVCAYLMWKRNYSLPTAITFLRTKRKEAFFWSVNFRWALESYAYHLDETAYPMY